jgi:hypothetical protein
MPFLMQPQNICFLADPYCGSGGMSSRNTEKPNCQLQRLTFYQTGVSPGDWDMNFNFKRSRRISPQVRPVCLVVARFKHGVKSILQIKFLSRRN